MNNSKASILADIKVNPDTKWFPGSGILQHLLDSTAGMGLLLCGLAFVASAVTWGVCTRMQNPEWASRGKAGVVAAVVAAFLVGGVATFINFAFGAGGTL